MVTRASSGDDDVTMALYSEPAETNIRLFVSLKIGWFTAFWLGPPQVHPVVPATKEMAVNKVKAALIIVFFNNTAHSRFGFFSNSFLEFSLTGIFRINSERAEPAHFCS
jgi:hypothetical protein